MTTQQVIKEIKNNKCVYIGEKNVNFFVVSYNNIKHWDQEAQESFKKMTYSVTGYNTGVTKYYFDQAQAEKRIKKLLRKHGKTIQVFDRKESNWERFA